MHRASYEEERSCDKCFNSNSAETSSNVRAVYTRAIHTLISIDYGSYTQHDIYIYICIYAPIALTSVIKY